MLHAQPKRTRTLVSIALYGCLTIFACDLSAQSPASPPLPSDWLAEATKNLAPADANLLTR